ncbi:MAG TPA: NIPSNAP family protein [Blastocatellia bacterium]
MNRRDVLKTGLAASVASAANVPAVGAESNHFYDLRIYELRNDIQPARLQEFFQNQVLPMMKRHGVGPVGCFNVISGLRSPSLVVVIDYKSLADMQSAMEAMRGDKEFVKAWQAFDSANEMPYTRYDSTLLKAFDSHPKIEIPPAGKEDEKRPPRVFELRTYESRSGVSLRHKIDMFNQEEIKIFRDCGFATVFFGEAVAGARLPHLTYMLGFDDMAAREKAWDAFRVNPDWARVKNKPGWTDPEAVSNIHASFLRPTAFSQIR